MFFWDPPRKKNIFEGIFRFEKFFFEIFFGADRREQRKEGTTERGNDWNDNTSALFKNLVIKIKKKLSIKHDSVRT